MKTIDLTIPLGIGTPPWPTYEPLQVKYFKRLAPNGANGQLVTHSNHIGTHLDGEKDGRATFQPEKVVEIQIFVPRQDHAGRVTDQRAGALQIGGYRHADQQIDR